MKRVFTLYCHGLGSSPRSRLSTQLKTELAGTEHIFEALTYPRGEVWRVTEWEASLQQRLSTLPDNQPVLLIGQSAGAHPVLNTAIRLPHRIAGIFLVSPGFNVDFDYVGKMMPGAERRLERGERIMHPASKYGEEIPVDLDSFVLYQQNCVSRRQGNLPINCPVSIVHGDKDDLVPCARSRELLSRLESSNAILREIPGGAHHLNMDDTGVRLEFYSLLNKISSSTAGHNSALGKG